MKNRIIIVKINIHTIRKFIKRDGAKVVRQNALTIMDLAISTLLNIKCKTRRRVLEVSDRDLIL